MRHLLLALILSVPITIHAQEFSCTKKIDQKKAVVFIDANSSFLEVEAAEKAACERGELFVIIPALPDRKDMIKNAKKMEILFEQISGRCSNKYDDDCAQIRSEYLDFSGANGTLLRNLPLLNDSLLKSELSNLASHDIAITSVILSGHNGGGSTSGSRGRVSKSTFLTAYLSAYDGKPALQKELQSALLWGCYTTTHSEVVDWKTNFPQLKIIAGFAASGPSNQRSIGHELMTDILVKESSLISSESMEAAKLAFEGLLGASSTFIGLYAQCSEKKEEFYMSNSDMNMNFERFSSNAGCGNFASQWQELRMKMSRYYEGWTAIPDVTSTGPLRDIYTMSRHFAHCVDQDSLLNADRMGLLLFFKGVLRNASQTFQPEIEEALKECSDKSIFNGKKDLSFQSNAIDYFEKACQTFSKLTDPTKVGELTRREITMALSNLDGLSSIFKLRRYSSIKKNFKNSMKLRKIMSHYLYDLDPKCMDFDLWHEYKPGVKVEGKCKF